MLPLPLMGPLLPSEDGLFGQNPGQKADTTCRCPNSPNIMRKLQPRLRGGVLLREHLRVRRTSSVAELLSARADLRSRQKRANHGGLQKPHLARIQPGPHHPLPRWIVFHHHLDFRVHARTPNLRIGRFDQLEAHWTRPDSTVAIDHTGV